MVFFFGFVVLDPFDRFVAKDLELFDRFVVEFDRFVAEDLDPFVPVDLETLVAVALEVELDPFIVVVVDLEPFVLAFGA